MFAYYERLGDLAGVHEAVRVMECLISCQTTTKGDYSPTAAKNGCA